MAWAAFPSIHLPPEQADRLLMRLAAGRQVWGSQAGADGLWRLQPGACVMADTPPQLPFIPLKKLLLPDGDPLWSWGEEGYAVPPAPPAILLVGAALCDLQALACLDRTFVADDAYLARRARLLVVGTVCLPSAECACQPTGLTPGGDLLLAGGRLWALSSQGEEVMAEEGGESRVEVVPLPGPVADHPLTAVNEAQFLASAGAPLWSEEAARCLACGACSAVCPTCSCFEVLDDAGLDDTVIRRRVWDNCFFPDHARVAGGYDFRAGRAARLRFRFEHKRVGFGAMRGMASCVGCGRCRLACPVGIDLEPIAAKLLAESP